MKAEFLWMVGFVILSVSLSPGKSLAGTPTDVHGRACLMVEEIRSGDTTPFDGSSKPGPDKKLILFAEADADCVLVVAAFQDKDRNLANGWMPQIVEMKAWEELRLPSDSRTSPWGPDSQDFDMHVVFADAKAKGLEPLKQLISQMQKETGGKLLEAQGKKLREDLIGWIASGNAGIFHPGSASAAWGGTLRAGRPPWRASAQNVVFPAGRQAVLIYRYGR